MSSRKFFLHAFYQLILSNLKLKCYLIENCITFPLCWKWGID